MNAQAAERLFTEMLDLLTQHQALLGKMKVLLLQDAADLEELADRLEKAESRNRDLEMEIEEWRKLSETLNSENDSLMRQNRELLSLQKG